MSTRTDHAARRAAQNPLTHIERLEVAARVLLRLCCLMAVRPSKGEYSSRSRVHSSIAGPLANFYTLIVAAKTLYEWLPGLDRTSTARAELSLFDPSPMTTNFPSLSLSQLKRAYLHLRAQIYALRAADMGVLVVFGGFEGRIEAS